MESKGVYISTYGCQMNVNDSERMYALLEMLDYTPVESPEEAHLILINSCSVREKPVHKVRSEVGRYRGLKKSKSELKIGVAGCVAQQEKKKLLDENPLIDFVVGTDAIDELPDIVARMEGSSERVVSARFEHQKPYQIQTLVRAPGVSTFVNIMKGCDNFCTFCVVPFTRGRERSRTLDEILKDIKALTARGVKEVTLLGQNVNSYKSSCGANFATLLKQLCLDTDLLRIRYTTSHPKDFDEELAQVSQEFRSQICDYIHLPVQSGNTEVLGRMNRGYSREEYLRKVEMIRKYIPGVALSTDFIVGFPGETDEQFEDTLSLIKEVRYDNIYAFNYSPRPLTRAAKYEDQVADDVKNERLQRLLTEQKQIGAELAYENVGRDLEILVERCEEGICTGRSSQNRIIHFAGDKDLIGCVVSVKITEARPQTLRGERNCP